MSSDTPSAAAHVSSSALDQDHEHPERDRVDTPSPTDSNGRRRRSSEVASRKMDASRSSAALGIRTPEPKLERTLDDQRIDSAVPAAAAPPSSMSHDLPLRQYKRSPPGSLASDDGMSGASSASSHRGPGSDTVMRSRDSGRAELASSGRAGSAKRRDVDSRDSRAPILPPVRSESVSDRYRLSASSRSPRSLEGRSLRSQAPLNAELPLPLRRSRSPGTEGLLPPSREPREAFLHGDHDQVRATQRRGDRDATSSASLRNNRFMHIDSLTGEAGLPSSRAEESPSLMPSFRGYRGPRPEMQHRQHPAYLNAALHPGAAGSSRIVLPLPASGFPYQGFSSKSDRQGPDPYRPRQLPVPKSPTSRTTAVGRPRATSSVAPTPAGKSDLSLAHSHATPGSGHGSDSAGPSSVPHAFASAMSSKQQQSFVSKLYAMLEDRSISDMIDWTPDGTAFSVANPSEFSRLILPNWFKHSNWQSFVRQLNMYGFHKVNHTFQGNPNDEVQVWEFKHSLFRRGDVQALADIKRKAARHRNSDSQSRSLAAAALASGIPIGDYDSSNLYRGDEGMQQDMDSPTSSPEMPMSNSLPETLSLGLRFYDRQGEAIRVTAHSREQVPQRAVRHRSDSQTYGQAQQGAQESAGPAHRSSGIEGQVPRAGPAAENSASSIDLNLVAGRISDVSERVDAIIRHSSFVEKELLRLTAELAMSRQTEEDQNRHLMLLESQVRFLTERLERFEDAAGRSRDLSAQPATLRDQPLLHSSGAGQSARSQQPRPP